MARRVLPRPPMAVQRATTETPTDALDAAHAAGLHYTSDARPGIRRVRAGRGFAYRDTDGRTIRDATTLGRIRRLAVPPAWTDVWISPDPLGHIQATGRDARGRKQYRYHERWREVRDETKYGRMADFAKALPLIRRRVHADLRRSGLPKEKVVACVVALLEKTLIRVGNDEYARENGSFGLTTLRSRHASVTGSKVRFRFRGKSGIEHEVRLIDRRLARVIDRCQDLPGQELFQYADDGDARAVSSEDVNAYLREVSGADFTAKDFRTWAGTVLAARALSALEHASETEAKKNVLIAIDEVARTLGNTRAICRKSYVHPAIIGSYMDGSLARRLAGKVVAELRSRGGLTAEERVVLALVRPRARRARAA